MDLDKIKETWKNAELTPSSIDEQKLQLILDSRGTSALEKLIKYERWGLFGMVFCIFLAPIFGIKHLAFAFIYSVSCLIGFSWQFHKYELLKAIDLERMNLITVSSKFTKYSSYISKEVIIGIIWLILFLGSYIAHEIVSENQTSRLLNGDIAIICIIIIPLIISVLATLWLYKKMYLNNIKAVKQSIDELKSFEEE